MRPCPNSPASPSRFPSQTAKPTFRPGRASQVRSFLPWSDQSGVNCPNLLGRGCGLIRRWFDHRDAGPPMTRAARERQERENRKRERQKTYKRHFICTVDVEPSSSLSTSSTASSQSPYLLSPDPFQKPQANLHPKLPNTLLAQGNRSALLPLAQTDTRSITFPDHNLSTYNSTFYQAHAESNNTQPHHVSLPARSL